MYRRAYVFNNTVNFIRIFNKQMIRQLFADIVFIFKIFWLQKIIKTGFPSCNVFEINLSRNSYVYLEYYFFTYKNK